MQSDYLARFFQIVPIGLVSGMLSGTFGIGGGIITVPLIRHVVGVTAQVAVGNSLAVMLPTSLIAAINYLKQGKVIPALALSCGIPAILGTAIGSALCKNIRGQTLMLVLAGFMVLAGLEFVVGIGNRLKKTADLKAVNADAKNSIDSGSTGADTKFELNSHNLSVSLILGVMTGLISGLLGVGGGFIMVPSFCYFMAVPLKIAFGTSLTVITLVALPGTIIHAINAHVQLSIVLPMLAGSLPGAWIGSYCALKINDKSLGVLFGSLLLLMAFVLAYRELTVPAS